MVMYLYNIYVYIYTYLVNINVHTYPHMCMYVGENRCKEEILRNDVFIVYLGVDATILFNSANEMLLD